MPAQVPDLPAAQQRATEFVRELLSRYSSYHDAKESMAFTGFTLFAGAMTASLVSDSWPPWWGYHSTRWALLALSITWLGFLLYLRFQLRRRRFAALRVAGCEHVLARWILSPPGIEELTPKDRDLPPLRLSRAEWLWDWVCPLRRSTPVLKKLQAGEQPIYPADLVAEWVAIEEKGTDALLHERLITLAGWMLFGVAFVYTCWKSAV